MTRDEVIRFARDEMTRHKLDDWGLRLTDNPKVLGLCDHNSKVLFLNCHHILLHPKPEIENTIRHEIAHALVGRGHGHDITWQDKAREVGCTNTASCSHLDLPPHLIDALRSGHSVEVTYETEVIHRPKYQVTRLQEKCPTCGKVAEERNVMEMNNEDPFKPNQKWIWLKCGHVIIKNIPKGTPFQTMVSNFWQDEVKSCKHEWNAEGQINQCVHCGEYKLYPFQVEGARFIETALSENKGGVIADEMGLGKTVQFMSYLKFHPEAFPCLIVTKGKVKFQMFKEALRWLGPDYLAQIIETSKDILIPGLKLYIASYDIFVTKIRKVKGKDVIQGFDIKRMIDAGVKTVILDECQQIKNPDAARTQEIRKLAKSTLVIGASGTPWKNRGSEYFTILNMVSPTKFPSEAQFKRDWVAYYEHGEFTKEGGIKNIPRFKEYVKDIVIRREVSEVMKEMPDVNKTRLYTNPSKLYQDGIDEETQKFVDWYNEKVMSGEEDSINGQNIIAKLARMRHLIGLAKVDITEAYIEDFLENNEAQKIAVFVHHKDVGDTLFNWARDTYEKKGFTVMKITGEMNSMDTFEAQEKFNKNDKAIAILSTLAAGEGLNLQTCGWAIMHERQWNPANEEQAAPGRFRRIGSKFKTINVIYNLAAGTVDEILDGINARKEKFFNDLMNEGRRPEWNEADIAREVANIIIRNYNKRKRSN